MADRTSPISRAASARLKRVKGFILDMDGTLVLGDRRNKGLRALPGALELVAHLQTNGIPFVMFTNGTVRPPQDYVGELKHAGFSVTADQIMTPASVAAEYLSAKGF